MQNNMLRKGLVLGVIILFVGASIIPSTGGTNVEKQDSIEEKTSFMVFNPRGNILYVGGSGGGNYSTIQAAINDANNGDTVFVYDDSSPYVENVIVNKSINLIGEDREETIIQALANDFAIQVVEDDVDIDSFTIIGEVSDSVKLDGSRYVNITNCDIKNGYNGIYITGSTSKYNYITNCEIYNNQGLGNADGIEMSGGANNNWIINCYIHDNGYLYEDGDGIRITGTTTGANHVINCTIEDNGKGGMYGDGVEISDGANGNWIINCNISGSNDSDGAGIKICSANSDGNRIINCTCFNNYRGIFIYKRSGGGNEIKNCDVFQNIWDGIHLEGTQLYRCTDHIIKNCNIYENGYNGIYLKFSNYNDIINCNLSENNYGICLFRSTDNIISENTIVDNKEVGVYLQLLSNKNNIYQNNFINNAKDAFFSLSLSNTWDQNFWNKARSLPKPIFGIMGIIPWVNFDWHPAQEPYDIPGGGANIGIQTQTHQNSQQSSTSPCSQSSKTTMMHTGTVEVTVKHALLKTPLKDACVVAYNLDTEEWYYVLPDENNIGVHIHYSLPVGDYLLGVGKEGYSIDGTTVVIKEGQHATHTFYLRPESSGGYSNGEQGATSEETVVNQQSLLLTRHNKN